MGEGMAHILGGMDRWAWDTNMLLTIVHNLKPFLKILYQSWQQITENINSETVDTGDAALLYLKQICLQVALIWNCPPWGDCVQWLAQLFVP